MTDSTTITIYRVEHRETCFGPYAGGSMSMTKFLLLRDGNLEDARTPEPKEDPAIWDFMQSLEQRVRRETPHLSHYDSELSKWMFGFRTLDAFHDWFHTLKSREILDDNGYVVRAYQVDQEHVGVATLSQVMFRHDLAHRIGTMSCLIPRPDPVDEPSIPGLEPIIQMDQNDDCGFQDSCEADTQSSGFRPI